jgi:hypothetical protein
MIFVFLVFFVVNLKYFIKMENTEIKRPYEKPEIQVIELESTPQLLALSGDRYGRDYDGEGR